MVSTSTTEQHRRVQENASKASLRRIAKGAGRKLRDRTSFGLWKTQLCHCDNGCNSNRIRTTGGARGSNSPAPLEIGDAMVRTRTDSEEDIPESKEHTQCGRSRDRRSPPDKVQTARQKEMENWHRHVVLKMVSYDEYVGSERSQKTHQMSFRGHL
eukprot:3093451-Amphidinium_carterae.3